MPVFDRVTHSPRRETRLASVAFAVLAFGSAVMAASVPTVGEVAPNFTLQTLDDQSVDLATLVQNNAVVLVVLRGWPGYQCPLCTRQVHDFIAHADSFVKAQAKVVMIYPGPSAHLKQHAGEFLQNKSWPGEFTFALDPDFAFAKTYGLRWDAPKETVYPATFIIERGGRIRLAHVSESHGNRLSAARAIAALKL